jgi:hypothetical protein
MNLTVFRAACFTIGHICYVDSSLAIELPNAYRLREKETMMYVILFWGVGLAALSWLALEGAEWGED